MAVWHGLPSPCKSRFRGRVLHGLEARATLEGEIMGESNSVRGRYIWRAVV